MMGRSEASAMQEKCAIAISAFCPRVNGAGGNTSSADAPPAVAARAIRAASWLPSAHTPCTMGSSSPTSPAAISMTRRCSSNVQEATSVEWALTVIAEQPCLDFLRRHLVLQLFPANAKLLRNGKDARDKHP